MLGLLLFGRMWCDASSVLVIKKTWLGALPTPLTKTHTYGTTDAISSAADAVCGVWCTERCTQALDCCPATVYVRCGPWAFSCASVCLCSHVRVRHSLSLRLAGALRYIRVGYFMIWMRDCRVVCLLLFAVMWCNASSVLIMTTTRLVVHRPATRTRYRHIDRLRPSAYAADDVRDISDGLWPIGSPHMVYECAIAHPAALFAARLSLTGVAFARVEPGDCDHKDSPVTQHQQTYCEHRLRRRCGMGCVVYRSVDFGTGLRSRHAVDAW